MLDEAKRFEHPNLDYVLTDSRNLSFNSNYFDSVVSVNSILPPKREDVNFMVGEVYRVLRPGGVFVAFLCSYDNVQEANKIHGMHLTCDDDALAVTDTTGWQCFHTLETITDMMDGFIYNTKKIMLDTKQEISEIERLYGIDTTTAPLYEYLLVATK